MKNTKFKFLIFLFVLTLPPSFFGQSLDSLSIIDSRYDSILKSNGEAMNTLFYKHDNDVLINNLGPYGSPFYYPTTSYLKNKKLIIKPDTYKEKIFWIGKTCSS